MDDKSTSSVTLIPGQVYISGFIYPYNGNTSAPKINKNMIVVFANQGLVNPQIAVAKVIENQR